MENKIPIIYQDDHLIIVDKPIDVPVHKNSFMPRDAIYLTKSIGQQTGKSIYNVHRLDAKTSGIIALAFSSDIAHELSILFEKHQVKKTYHAIVKDIPEASGVFNEDVLIKKKGKKAKALTNYNTINTISTDISYKSFENISLSHVEINPETGRWHQIRQHFAMHRFDIIGDTHHGDWTLNKIVTEKTGFRRLFLHAHKISFVHPVSNNEISFSAPLPEEFRLIIEKLKSC